jgi:hypothetical protein
VTDLTEAGPGVIKGRLQSRDHSVDVRIPYTATSYSINYESSMNLKAADGKIHKNYNRWVNNLDHDIQLNPLRWRRAVIFFKVGPHMAR